MSACRPKMPGPYRGAVGLGKFCQIEQVGAGRQPFEFLEGRVLGGGDRAIPLGFVPLGKIATQGQTIFAVVSQCIRGPAKLRVAAAQSAPASAPGRASRPGRSPCTARIRSRGIRVQQDELGSAVSSCPVPPRSPPSVGRVKPARSGLPRVSRLMACRCSVCFVRMERTTFN